MFNLKKLPTSEKLTFPQTMPGIEKFNKLFNTALLFTCGFLASPESAMAQEGEELPEVMRTYARIIDTECQYNLAGNLNPNIQDLATTHFEGFDRPAIFANNGSGYTYKTIAGECRSTASLTGQTESHLVFDTSGCGKAPGVKLSTNPGHIQIRVSHEDAEMPQGPENRILPGVFHFWSYSFLEDDLALNDPTHPMASDWRRDLFVDFPNRQLLFLLRPHSSDIYSPDAGWVREYLVRVGFDEVATYLQDGAQPLEPQAILFEHHTHLQADRIESFYALSPDVFVTVDGRGDSEIFGFDPEILVNGPASVLNPELLEVLAYEPGTAIVPDYTRSYKNYKIRLDEDGEYQVYELSCTLEDEPISDAYTIPNSITDPAPPIPDPEADLGLENDAGLQVDANLPEEDLQAPEIDDSVEPEEDAGAEVPVDEDAELPEIDAEMDPEEDAELPEIDAEIVPEEDAELPEIDAEIVPEEDAELPEVDDSVEPEADAYIPEIDAEMEPEEDAGPEDDFASREFRAVLPDADAQEQEAYDEPKMDEPGQDKAPDEGCSQHSPAEHTTPLLVLGLLAVLRKKFTWQK